MTPANPDSEPFMRIAGLLVIAHEQAAADRELVAALSGEVEALRREVRAQRARIERAEQAIRPVTR